MTYSPARSSHETKHPWRMINQQEKELIFSELLFRKQVNFYLQSLQQPLSWITQVGTGLCTLNYECFWLVGRGHHNGLRSRAMETDSCLWKRGTPRQKRKWCHQEEKKMELCEPPRANVQHITYRSPHSLGPPSSPQVLLDVSLLWDLTGLCQPPLLIAE